MKQSLYYVYVQGILSTAHRQGQVTNPAAVLLIYTADLCTVQYDCSVCRNHAERVLLVSQATQLNIKINTDNVATCIHMAAIS